MGKTRILCFGDSLTWGYNPKTGNRLHDDERWTGILQEELGKNFTIIEEGQNGRTICTEDPAEGEKNGLKYLQPCMESHSPLDYMIIMLGTNDLKQKFNYAAMDIAGEMEMFLQKVLMINRFKMKNRLKVILMAPPIVGENIRESWFGDSFGYENAIEVSKKLAEHYKILSEIYKIGFINAADYVEVSKEDSIHMDAANHEKLGKVVAEYIKHDMKK